MSGKCRYMSKYAREVSKHIKCHHPNSKHPGYKITEYPGFKDHKTIDFLFVRGSFFFLSCSKEMTSRVQASFFFAKIASSVLADPFDGATASSECVACLSEAALVRRPRCTALQVVRSTWSIGMLRG